MSRIKVAPKIFENGDHDILHVNINTEKILTNPSQKFPHLEQVEKIRPILIYYMAHRQGYVILNRLFIEKLFVCKAPKDPELKKIFEELKFIADKMRNENLTSEYEEEWKYAAIVVDRLLSFSTSKR